jgi:hypothetical protein
MSELPAADPSLLPAMRERGGELGRQFVDVFVGFRLRFQDEREADDFARHFRFASMRSALRQEGGGVVWVGFHGWAFDAEDAQMQAALAVRHSAIRARCRYIPVATDAEVRATDALLLRPDQARRERDELLAKLHETVPRMLTTQRAPVGTAAPERRQLAAGAPQAPRPSAPPPGFAAKPVRKRRWWRFDRG